MLLVAVKPNVTLSFGSLDIWYTKNFTVSDHMIACNNTVSFENFYVLANGSNNFKTKLQEILLIHRDGLQFSKTSESVTLML